MSYLVAAEVVLTDGLPDALDDTLVRRARRAVREARSSDAGVHVAELTTPEG